MLEYGSEEFEWVSSYSITHFDFPFLSFGHPTLGDDSIEATTAEGEWRRVALKDGKVVGGVLIGDLSPQSAFKQLMREGRDVSDQRDLLMEPGFSDDDRGRDRTAVAGFRPTRRSVGFPPRRCTRFYMSRGNDDEPSPPDGGFFSSVVEESRDPIVSIDDAGAIVYANPAAEDALGRDAASLADRRLAELIPDATTNRRAASLRDRLVEPARLDDAGDVSVPLAAADGETRTFSVRFHAHDVDGKPVYTGVFRERSSGDRDREFRTFRNLVEHAGHAIYVTDTDGTIEYVNPAFTRHTGYEPEQVIGETPAVLNSGEMSDEYFVSLWETLCAGEVWEEEIVDRRKDGTHYHAHQTIAPVFDDAGTVSRFVAIQTDVTERKAAEGKLKQYRDIVERLDDPIMLQNRDGEFELLNEAVSEFAGTSREELYDDDETAFMDTETAAEIDERRQEVLRTEEPVEYEVSPSFERSGRDATFSTRRYPYYDGAEALAGTFAICRDVTEIEGGTGGRPGAIRARSRRRDGSDRRGRPRRAVSVRERAVPDVPRDRRRGHHRAHTGRCRR